MIIDYTKIENLLNKTTDPIEVKDILAKSKELKRLNLSETATLLNSNSPDIINQIYSTAKEVKNNIYGKRLVIFAPLYVSNLCKNDCAYCAFRIQNKHIARKALSQKEIQTETENLLKEGQKRVLLVSGEAYPQNGLQYILDSIKTIYNVNYQGNKIRRINVNIAPLEINEFKQLKESNIGTYQLFQETYHKPTYNKVHLFGPKKDYDYRLSAIDRAFQAGIDDVGIGILFGLYNYKFEILALLSHIEYLEKKYGMGPHTISVPRLEPADGTIIASNPPYPVTDNQFKKIISILRLSVPYTGLILSTRETPETRRNGFDLGISQISAGSKTNPGGYSQKERNTGQFSLGDHRSLDQVIYDVCEKGYIPSFCTACYRLGRTGLDFMEYAKPGEIQKKCYPNALFTFQEYLNEFASPKTKIIGEKLIKDNLNNLEDKEKYLKILNKIKKGSKDLYI